MPTKFNSSVILRVELLGIEPLIWRRVRVPAAMTLRELHGVLQIAMGWQDCHLHEFRVGDVLVGIVDRPELDTPENMEDERNWTVAKIVASGAADFEYVYDFGDHWMHRVIAEPATRSRIPGSGVICLAGEGACPPEDMGGPPGYAQFLEALADASHSEHKTYVGCYTDVATESARSSDDSGRKGETTLLPFRGRARARTAERPDPSKNIGGVWDVKGFDANRVNRELMKAFGAN